MSYVLDGIETAMEIVETMGCDPREVVSTCPCGWSTMRIVKNPSEALEVYASARFHYTHCPQARVAPKGGGG